MKNYIKVLALSIATLITTLFACNPGDQFEIDHVTFGDPAIGIPLINSSFFISDFGTNPGENTTILTDDEGRLTIRYNGEVLRQEKSDIFFNIPYIGPDFELTSTSTEIALPVPNVVITRAVFESTNVFFKFENPVSSNIVVNVNIPEFSKDGQVFTTEIVVPPGEGVFVSDPISLTDVLIQTETTTFTVNYSATLVGEEIALDFASFTIDVLSFSSAQGNFGFREFNLSEEIIDVNIFNQWISGGIDFDSPTINFEIENSFGFPVKTDFKKLELVTINGDTLQLTGDQLEEGITFNFPTLDQIGETVPTSFTFDSDNSNIGALFNEKAVSVTYDVDAIVNPDDNPDAIGFFNNESFFTVNVSLDLPMSLQANDLVMADTIAIDSIPFGQFSKDADFFLRVKNAFPVDLGVNMEFLGDNDVSLFELIDDTEWLTTIASPDPTLTFDDLVAQNFEINIPESSVSQITDLKKVVIKANLTTSEQFGDNFVWLFGHHGIDIQLRTVLD